MAISLNLGLQGTPGGGGGNDYEATVAAITAPREMRVADTGRGIGANIATVYLPEITAALGTPDDAEIEATVVLASDDSEVQAYQSVGSMSGGTLAGASFTVASARGVGEPVKLKTRVAGSSVEAIHDDEFDLGSNVLAMCQSEGRQLQTGTAASATFPANLPSDPDQVGVAWLSSVTGGAGSPVTAVTAATWPMKTGSVPSGHGGMVQIADSMIRQGLTERLAFTFSSIAGTGQGNLMTDADTRRNMSDEDTLAAAAGHDLFPPGLVQWAWWQNPSDSVPWDYLHAFITGRYPDGTSCPIGTDFVCRDVGGSGTETYTLDNILFDTTGAGRGRYDAAKTAFQLIVFRHDAQQTVAQTAGTTFYDDGGAATPNDVLKLEYFKQSLTAMFATPTMAALDASYEVAPYPADFDAGAGSYGIHQFTGVTGDGMMAEWWGFWIAGALGLHDKLAVTDAEVTFDSGPLTTATVSVPGVGITTSRIAQSGTLPADGNPLRSDVMGFTFFGSPFPAGDAVISGGDAVLTLDGTTFDLANMDPKILAVEFGRGHGGGSYHKSQDCAGAVWLDTPGVLPGALGLPTTTANLTGVGQCVVPLSSKARVLAPAAYAAVPEADITGTHYLGDTASTIATDAGLASIRKIFMEAIFTPHDWDENAGFYIMGFRGRVFASINPGYMVRTDLAPSGGTTSHGMGIIPMGRRNKVQFQIDLNGASSTATLMVNHRSATYNHTVGGSYSQTSITSDREVFFGGNSGDGIVNGKLLLHSFKVWAQDDLTAWTLSGGVPTATPVVDIDASVQTEAAIQALMTANP